ncbi:tRNA(Ile)-lysidine synthase [Propionicimonas paludicola]|uniref:tRNA(Ile)-lysidine synthase n=2 Tax=Propionicimonas paludicola TaxID=185243 RepID=A0A2A9CVV6_9ACTN|nr:tRNA lysidine(34) synthetase TilS [Propionicimonas paludicola]PFG17719.1 tRNA(Ile)-lysidine synthase [Propionicimonas paludicola]
MAKKALGPATLAVVQAVEAVADAPLLVACSGGPDSLALALAAHIAAARRGVDVRAAIVDHGLQPGSDTVAATVAEQLAGRGVSAVVLTVTVPDSPDGTEAAARQARYAALEAEARPDELILLGHTLDDQAETVLLGLARGSGTRSLAGMPTRRGVFVRPLLGLRAAQTAQACAELGVEPWRDPHNDEPRFTRVRVRRQVLPLLEAELGPGIAEALARTAGLARRDADLLDQLAADHQLPAVGAPFAVAELAGLPAAIRGRVLRSWLRAAGATDLSATHLDAVDALLDDWRGQRWVELPGVRVSRRGGGLWAESSTPGTFGPQD